MRPAVLNASPVIILARAGFVDLLPKLLSPIVMPRAVSDEIQAGLVDDPARRFLAQRPRWMSIVEVAPALSPLASWRLGPGESEVLEYARTHRGTVAVLDDKPARRAARTLQLPLTGTLGLLIAAVHSGFLPSLPEALKAAKDSGLYVSPGTMADLTER